jgi:hypothetical protein
MVVRIPGGFLGQFVLNLGHLGQTGHATPPPTALQRAVPTLDDVRQLLKSGRVLNVCRL